MANNISAIAANQTSGPRLHPMFEFWAADSLKSTFILQSYIHKKLYILVIMFLCESAVVGIAIHQGYAYPV